MMPLEKDTKIKDTQKLKSFADYLDDEKNS